MTISEAVFERKDQIQEETKLFVWLYSQLNSSLTQNSQDLLLF